GPTGDARKGIPMKDNISGGQDIEFVCDISIGTPPQTFPIDPDTGSADLWVVDKSCQAANCGPNSRGKYSQKKSSSYAPIPNAPKFDLQYAIGDVSGQYARETVELAGVTIHKQTIGLANQTSPDWKDDLASGVLGLGFRAITSNNQRPFIENLASQGHLRKKVISFAFGRAASGTQGKSEMMLGGSNKSLFKGKISYYDVSRVAYWQTGFKQFASGSNAGVQNMDGIFDTGTSLIAAPSQQAAAFWKDVPNSQLSNDGTFYTYPCSQPINAKLTMPDGRSFKLSEKDLNFGKSPNDSSKCIGSVIVASTPGQIIFGLSALKNFYSVFD
ncbi:acid protease, partial [Meira miltonrushii]